MKELFHTHQICLLSYNSFKVLFGVDLFKKYKAFNYTINDKTINVFVDILIFNINKVLNFNINIDIKRQLIEKLKQDPFLLYNHVDEVLLLLNNEINKKNEVEIKYNYLLNKFSNLVYKVIYVKDKLMYEGTGFYFLDNYIITTKNVVEDKLGEVYLINKKPIKCNIYDIFGDIVILYCEAKIHQLKYCISSIAVTNNTSNNIKVYVSSNKSSIGSNNENGSAIFNTDGNIIGILYNEIIYSDKLIELQNMIKDKLNIIHYGLHVICRSPNPKLWFEKNIDITYQGLEVIHKLNEKSPFNIGDIIFQINGININDINSDFSEKVKVKYYSADKNDIIDEDVMLLEKKEYDIDEVKKTYIGKLITL